MTSAMTTTTTTVMATTMTIMSQIGHALFIRRQRFQRSLPLIIPAAVIHTWLSKLSAFAICSFGRSLNTFIWNTENLQYVDLLC